MPLEQGGDGDGDGDRRLYRDLYRSLHQPERRRILFHLLDHNPQEELIVPEDIQDGETALDQLQANLVHNHLPMLEQSGLIRWDRDEHQIHKGPNFHEVRELIEAIAEHDPLVQEE